MPGSILQIRPDEMDIAENVMRAQLGNFEGLVNVITTQVHSKLSACSGELYESLKGSYDAIIKTMMDKTEANVNEYIGKMFLSHGMLDETTNALNTKFKQL